MSFPIINLAQKISLYDQTSAHITALEVALEEFDDSDDSMPEKSFVSYMEAVTLLLNLQDARRKLDNDITQAKKGEGIVSVPRPPQQPKNSLLAVLFGKLLSGPDGKDDNLDRESNEDTNRRLAIGGLITVGMAIIIFGCITGF